MNSPSSFRARDALLHKHPISIVFIKAGDILRIDVGLEGSR
jgi:hypothetical protein